MKKERSWLIQYIHFNVYTWRSYFMLCFNVSIFLFSNVLIILGPQNIEDEVHEQVQSLDETYSEHGMN